MIISVAPTKTGHLMDKRKVLVLLTILIFFTLGLVSLPAANELAWKLRAPEAYAKLGDALTLLKRKAERYRFHKNAEPESFKELLAFEPDQPPYYQRNTVGFLEWERRRALTRPESESFKDVPDFALSLNIKREGSEKETNVSLWFGGVDGSKEKCRALAEQYLKLAVLHHDVLKAPWYSSFRVSRSELYAKDASGALRRELTLWRFRAEDGGPIKENLAEARMVCGVSEEDLETGQWQIEWVGL